MASVVVMPRARGAYLRPALVPLATDGELPRVAGGAPNVHLRPMELLGVIQSCFDELELPLDGDLVELKLRILKEVSEGRLTAAVRLAIFAAGNSRCGCSD